MDTKPQNEKIRTNPRKHNALMSQLLGFMVGGLARNFQANYRVGRGPFVVLEGDEYDTAFFDKRPKFVHFKPRVAVLTSIEFDHADIYADLDHVIRAFESYLGTVAPDSRVLAWGDAPLVRQVCGRAGPRRCPFTVRATTATGGPWTWRRSPAG